MSETEIARTKEPPTQQGLEMDTENETQAKWITEKLKPGVQP